MLFVIAGRDDQWCLWWCLVGQLSQPLFEKIGVVGGCVFLCSFAMVGRARLFFCKWLAASKYERECLQDLRSWRQLWILVYSYAGINRSNLDIFFFDPKLKSLPMVLFVLCCCWWSQIFLSISMRYL